MIDATQAAMIEPLIDQLSVGLGGSDESEIERMIGKMSLLYPNGKLSDAEAAVRLDLYIELLRDIPFDCLSHGFREAAKTTRFFPTVAEIREHAEPMLRARKAKIAGLRSLKLKHDREWRAPLDPSDQCSPEQAAAILEKYGFRSIHDRADAGTETLSKQVTNDTDQLNV